ncbi:MAG: TspO/MBR family protein [Patescibacteria group bacterium]
MFLKILAAALFLLMVAVNSLANILPINGRDTGMISDAYPNLFAPAGLTFSIWGLIYILLAAYTIYQFGFFRGDPGAGKGKILRSVNIYFIISSLLNISWIFAWHYDLIWLSFLIILALFFCLLKITRMLSHERFTALSKALLVLPFSIYLAWITVANIANFTVFLVSLGWNGLGLGGQIWTMLALLLGAASGAILMLKDKNLAYSLVFIWAYAGILIKHLSASGFNGEYPAVIITVILSLAFFILIGGRLVYSRTKS